MPAACVTTRHIQWPALEPQRTVGGALEFGSGHEFEMALRGIMRCVSSIADGAKRDAPLRCVTANGFMATLP